MHEICRINQNLIMNILIFSHVPTYPLDQGNRQRVFEICSFFKSKGAILHFAYYPREWGGRYDINTISKMNKQWDFFEIIPPQRPLKYQPTQDFHGIDEWWDKNIEDYIKLKLTGVDFDACIVNYTFFSKFFEFLPKNVIKILDTHDRIGGRKELLLKYGIESNFFHTTHEQEKIGLDRADIILGISEEETKHYRSLSEKCCFWLGHSFNNKFIKSKKIKNKKVKFGFIGSKNQVNSENMSKFIGYTKQFYSTITDEFEIIVAGQCCEDLSFFEDIHWLKLIGRVENIKDFYNEIDCVIVPLFFGTGQKIKTIEALSYGLPLLAASHASLGTGSTSKYHNINSNSQFLQIMREIASNNSLLTAISKESRKTLTSYNTQLETKKIMLLELLEQISIKVMPLIYEKDGSQLEEEFLSDLLTYCSGLKTLKNEDRTMENKNFILNFSQTDEDNIEMGFGRLNDADENVIEEKFSINKLKFFKNIFEKQEYQKSKENIIVFLIDNYKNSNLRQLLNHFDMFTKSLHEPNIKAVFLDKNGLAGNYVSGKIHLEPNGPISMKFLKTMCRIIQSNTCCTVLFEQDLSDLSDITKFFAINSNTVFKINKNKIQKELNFINVSSIKELFLILQKFKNNFDEAKKTITNNSFIFFSEIGDSESKIDYNIWKFKNNKITEFQDKCVLLEESYFEKK